VVGHYSSTRAVDLKGLRARYERLKAMPAAEATRGSPLLDEGKADAGALPRFFTLREMEVSDLNLRQTGAPGTEATPEQVAGLVAGLNGRGFWPTPLKSTSNPYKGPGPRTPVPGDFASTHVGDDSDTSPYPAETGVMGISTGTYIRNMGVLIAALAAEG
jgi:hypothetical protein